MYIPNMELTRCPWVDLTKQDYIEYHDREWGVPIYNDRLWFEFLTLESAQAGLSWYTVLRKRENYRAAFNQFDPVKISKYTETKIERLLHNPGIIRNKLKIKAAINNAKRFIEVQNEFKTFDAYIWKFVNRSPIVNSFKTIKDYPITTFESDALSKDLRTRGFTFVGSTICYAHMQATGMVNDHTLNCFRRSEIIQQYKKNRLRQNQKA